VRVLGRHRVPVRERSRITCGTLAAAACRVDFRREDDVSLECCAHVFVTTIQSSARSAASVKAANDIAASWFPSLWSLSGLRRLLPMLEAPAELPNTLSLIEGPRRASNQPLPSSKAPRSLQRASRFRRTPSLCLQPASRLRRTPPRGLQRASRLHRTPPLCLPASLSPSSNAPRGLQRASRFRRTPPLGLQRASYADRTLSRWLR
jgi:hypothetical protein